MVKISSVSIRVFAHIRHFAEILLGCHRRSLGSAAQKRVAEDRPMFFLHASAVSLGALSEYRDDVRLESTDDQFH